MRCSYRPCYLLDRRDDLRGAKRKTDCDILHVYIHYSFFDLQKLLKAAPRGCFDILDNIIFNTQFNNLFATCK